MIFLTRGLQKGRVCTAEASPLPCSSSTDAARTPVPTSVTRLWDGTENCLCTQQYERGLPTRSYHLPNTLLGQKEDFLLLLEKKIISLSLPNIDILIAPYAGQALQLPLTNTDGKKKTHKTPPPQPRNRSALQGLVDGQGPRVTYCRVYSFLSAAFLQAARHSAGAAASRGRCQPPPACDSAEQGGSPPSPLRPLPVCPSWLTPALEHEHAGRHGARCCPRRAVATGGTPAHSRTAGRRLRARRDTRGGGLGPAPPLGRGGTCVGTLTRGGQGSHSLTDYAHTAALCSAAPLFPQPWTERTSGTGAGELRMSRTQEPCREQGKGETKLSSCFQRALEPQ